MCKHQYVCTKFPAKEREKHTAHEFQTQKAKKGIFGALISLWVHAYTAVFIPLRRFFLSFFFYFHYYYYFAHSHVFCCKSQLEIAGTPSETVMHILSCAYMCFDSLLLSWILL